VSPSVSKKKSGDILLEMLAPEPIFGSTLLYKRTNLGSIQYDEHLIYVNDWKFYVDFAAEASFFGFPILTLLNCKQSRMETYKPYSVRRRVSTMRVQVCAATVAYNNPKELTRLLVSLTNLIQFHYCLACFSC